jgi:hypothetical protein
MTTRPAAAAIVSGAVPLSACNTPPTREQTGMVIDGVLGGLLGSEVGGGHVERPRSLSQRWLAPRSVAPSAARWMRRIG